MHTVALSGLLSQTVHDDSFDFRCRCVRYGIGGVPPGAVPPRWFIAIAANRILVRAKRLQCRDPQPILQHP
jgi:hypothetical protein